MLQTNKGPSLVGLATIASHLATEAKKDELLGVSTEEKAIVQQWLEYRITRIDKLSSKEDVRSILKVGVMTFVQCRYGEAMLFGSPVLSGPAIHITFLNPSQARYTLDQFYYYICIS